MSDTDKRYSVPDASRLSVAPMMDWTDRHCRRFHRVLSRRALLYTEMVAAAALVRGGALHLLGHNPEEHPVALQLGGAEPEMLAAAARMGAAAGFGEINLNCGCPSDRVRDGAFGAVLMADPAHAGACAAALAEGAAPAEATVKCRIGVDDQDPRTALPAFLEAMQAAGIRRVIVHARKAWLKGLSPKENRTVPPLDHGLVREMAAAFPALTLVLNGGIADADEARRALAAGGIGGVMAGRAAYQRPMDVLAPADAVIFGEARAPVTRAAAVAEMRPYIARHLVAGGRLHEVTRHMLGLFAGAPGARAWRRVLSTEGARADAGPDVLDRALEAACGARQAA